MRYVGPHTMSMPNSEAILKFFSKERLYLLQTINVKHLKYRNSGSNAIWGPWRNVDRYVPLLIPIILGLI